ncbi:MAG: hypothetical protein GX442_06795 [Candidatus Riflebacteria bacterium]|nr:hypothetical protein [Candidatus Riflebacteria bacterium]
MKRLSRRGLTLVELMVGSLLAALILLFLGKVARQAVATSTKGQAHLSNAHAASVFLRGLESDLERAVACSPEPSGDLVIEAVATLAGGSLGTETIRYAVEPSRKGFSRKVGAGDPVRFCEDLQFDPVTPGKPLFSSCPVPQTAKTGLRVCFRVRAPGGENQDPREELTLERFFPCGNATDGVRIPGRIP